MSAKFVLYRMQIIIYIDNVLIKDW